MADTYKIIEQRPTVDLSAAGTSQEVMEIVFTTKPHNQPGRVRVPMSQYTPDEVARIVGEAAENIETIQNL